MACGGPSKEFAVIKSEKAFGEIMQMLKDKYYIDRPDGCGPACGFDQRMKDDWDEQEKQLKAALADLFWTSDAANF